MSPPGNTPLPPLPGAGGVVHGTAAQTNPWADPASGGGPNTWGSPANVPQVNIPPERRADPFPGLPPAANTLVDRAPIGVLVVAAVIVLAVVAGAGYVLIKGGRQYPSQWDSRVESITKWVAKERELDFSHPVKVNFLSDEEYSARSTEGGDDDSAETKQYYDDQAAQLRALGFLTGEVDLAEANDTLSDSGTLAYYDPDLEQVFVRGTELTPSLRVTLAHELTHVLQDQNFDLSRLGDFDDGRAAVLRALAEGDAGKVEDAYVEEGLSDADRAAYMKDGEESEDDASEELDAKVPPILTTLFASPYILGPQLIGLLDAQDGWDAINAALEDPPTEEAMFDPTTYDTDAARTRTESIEPPSGAEVIDTSEFGPTAWYLLLAARLDPRVALEATDGWGGDRYVVYRADKKVCIDANVVGDTPADSEQLSEALEEWVAKSPKGTASVSSKDDKVTFHSCDPGKNAEPVGGEVTPDLLVLPVTRTQVYTEAVEAQQSSKEAKCFANGVIDRFTFAQLSDPKGAFIQSAAGQKILGELRAECFA